MRHHRVGTAIASFVVMEPATYAAHRWVMHGVGWVLHRSHHEDRVTDLQARAAALEANDAFPVIFGTVTVLAMAAGSRRSSLRALVSIGCGVTAYGAAYGLVHDVYIHARLGPPPVVGLLERLKEAHRFHHAYGGEPYGMLFPVVPARVRALAAR
ncbi:MAG: sterol desaturase family protein [Acidimicrobiales bacterium]